MFALETALRWGVESSQFRSIAETAEIEFAESTIYFNLAARLSFSSKRAEMSFRIRFICIKIVLKGGR
jgi:hypothetical protein